MDLRVVSIRGSTPLQLSLLTVLVLLWSSPTVSFAEGRFGHEIALGITGVYDSGYDRGLHYGLGYQFSWSMLHTTAFLSLGDSNPSREQHWALKIGIEPWRGFRFDIGFHHRTFTEIHFGENLITFICDLQWRGLELAAGYVLRFPILGEDEIHSPFVFDRDLFTHFLTFRLGYQYRFRSGLGLGFIIETHSRFEQHNLDYPQFALIISYEHPRAGRFSFDGGIGIAGFFNQASTIDRGFIRFQYVRGMGESHRARWAVNERNEESTSEQEIRNAD